MLSSSYWVKRGTSLILGHLQLAREGGMFIKLASSRCMKVC